MESVEQMLGGWGNCPVENCHVTRPHTIDAIRNIVASGDQENYIARGLGRAYGDSSLNADSGVMDQTLRNRFLAFDEESGVLTCEAGVSIAEIIETMLPRGWFMPVTPGTKFVTIGGAIAADVHGKNHHVVGSFGEFVREILLLTADGDVKRCTPDENVELFDATIGGMGLTGVIISATFEMKRKESAYCNVTYKRTRNLDQTLEHFERTNATNRYSVAWVDCLASGDSLGRSVIMLGNDASADDAPTDPLKLPIKPKKSVPFFFPAIALNNFTVSAFNTLYYMKNGDSKRIVDYDEFFYPLDGVQHWNRIYGKRGFIQYQALFPPETSRKGLIKLLERIAKSRGASFLAVLKSSGPAGRGVMSYLHPGHTLALDFPNTGEPLRQLVRDLDDILLQHGGRVYMAKDAMTSAEAFAEMYPQLDRFREFRNEIDPNRRFLSSQARRLKIVEA